MSFITTTEKKMQERVEHSPPPSPRKLEEQRLRKETNGFFAPAKPGIFTETRKDLAENEIRKDLAEKYLREGHEIFDAQQNQDDNTPPPSPRKLEEQRLRKETNGFFAPAKPGNFAEIRKELVEKYLQEGLEKFDEQQNQDDDDEELMFKIELT